MTTWAAYTVLNTSFLLIHYIIRKKKNAETDQGIAEKINLRIWSWKIMEGGDKSSLRVITQEQDMQMSWKIICVVF